MKWTRKRWLTEIAIALGLCLIIAIITWNVWGRFLHSF